MPASQSLGLKIKLLRFCVPASVPGHKMSESSSGLSKTSEAKSRTKGKRSAAVVPRIQTPLDPRHKAEGDIEENSSTSPHHSLPLRQDKRNATTCQETSTPSVAGQATRPALRQPVNGRRCGGTCENQTIRERTDVRAENRKASHNTAPHSTNLAPAQPSLCPLAQCNMKLAIYGSLPVISP
jgi:hypothetical protein